MLKTIAYEGDLKITNTSNKQFKYPTVSNLCLHPKTCYELEFILGEIAEKSFWKCEECRKSFVKEDLCKDFRYKV